MAPQGPIRFASNSPNHHYSYNFPLFLFGTYASEHTESSDSLRLVGTSTVVHHLVFLLTCCTYIQFSGLLGISTVYAIYYISLSFILFE